jgi:predicted HicB family RNase H-like nuclease
MKNSIMTYKQYFSIISYSSEDDIFHGKIEGIDDLVTFEGRSVDELKKAFQEAVEDYIETCKEIGKQPLKSYNGSFNVRIDPILHKKAVNKATVEGITLNKFVEKAIEKLVKA